MDAETPGTQGVFASDKAPKPAPAWLAISADEVLPENGKNACEA
jgi:hypothetical protein